MTAPVLNSQSNYEAQAGFVADSINTRAEVTMEPGMSPGPTVTGVTLVLNAKVPGIDAAGVVAPASGEGIYYAMVGGRLVGEAAAAFLKTGEAKHLRSARKAFMKEHGKVFWVLGMMQYFWYSSDKRRERFVTMCDDKDVQELTWQAYMNKRLVRAKPMSHVRVFLKDCAHLLGLKPVMQ